MQTAATKLAPDFVVAFLPIIGIAVIVAGIAILRHPDAVATFFRRAAKPMYGQKLSSRLYTTRGARAAGAGYVAFGCISIVVGIVVLIASHL
jgi:hypothetical protein